MGVNNDLLNDIISGLGSMPKKSEIDTPTNNIDLEATETKAGLMSAADKAKLNKIPEDVGKYELPVATKDTLGGVKTGSDVTDVDGLIPVPIIDGIPYYKPGASEVEMPIASGDTLGGVKIGENIAIDEDGTISVSDVSADKMTGILPVSKGGTGASDIHKARLNLKTSCFVVTGNTTDTAASNDGYYKAFSIPSSVNSKYTLRLLISSINALFDDFTVYVTLSTGDTTKDSPTGFIYSVKETHDILDKLLITYDSSITTGEYGFWYKNPSAKSAIRISVLQCIYSGDSVNDGYQMISINNAPRTALATITVGTPDVVSFGDILTTKLATQSMAGYMSGEDKAKLDSMSTSVPASLQSLRTDVDDAYDTIALLNKLTLNTDDKGSDIPYHESKETTTYQFSKPNGGTFTVSSDNTIRTYKNASSNNAGLMTSTDYDYLHGLPDTLSNLQETLTNNIGAQLESHISDTSNPHQVTKEQLGLGNVENKTSAVIRSELTKDNVTKGLGYTPIKSVKYDATVAAGVKIGALTVDDSSVDLYVPSDIDTHWASNLIVGGSKTANTNAAASNGSVFMNLIENDEIRSTHKIVGNTGIRVTSDANGDITITGTTYSSLKNPNALKIQINGVDNIEYDGSEEKTLDITPALIGASLSDHNHDDVYLKLTGGSLTGQLKIIGDESTTHSLMTRGLIGSDGDGNSGPLYLQYGANSVINLGNKAAYRISADGGQYTGNSASATKLTSSAGSVTQPIYFEDGKPVALTYTLEKSVPADAKFTDTVYDDSDVLAAIAANKSTVFYADCATVRSELAKTVTCDGFELKTGAMIAVRFTDTTTTNPTSGYFTLNINNTGAKNIGPKDNAGLYAYNVGNFFYNNQTLLLMYNGTYYIHINRDINTTYTPMSLGFGYGTCTTVEATTAKVVTLASYALITNGMVSVKFTYAVPANATLNINSRGAKNIFYRGAKIIAGVINAGDIATLVYDGTQYQLISIDKEYLHATALTHTNYTSTKNKLVTSGLLSFWNGAHDAKNTSNLRYCAKGEFGDIVTKNIADFALADHTHTVVNGHTVESDVPANAKFTDTVYDDSDVLAAIAANKSTVFYADCATAKNVVAKVIDCDGFILETGVIIVIRFTDTTTANPTAGNITLNINGTGAKNIVPKGNNTPYTYGWAWPFCNNQTWAFAYNGTSFICLNQDNNTTYTPMSLGFGYGTCTTVEATATKVVTLSNYNLITGGIVTVLFSYDVCANAQLNINNRGAKYIYYNNTKITSGIIKGGTTATFIYNGSAYILINISDDAKKVIVGTYSSKAPSNNGWYKAFELSRINKSWTTYSVRLNISPINVTNKSFVPIDVDIALNSNGTSNYLTAPRVYTSRPAHSILNDLYIVQNNPSDTLSADTTWEIWYHSTSSYSAIMIEIEHINLRDRAIEVWSALNINVARMTALDSYTSGKTAYSFASVATSNLPVVSTTENGLMTIDDKTKLDGISEGANKITVDTALSTTSTNPVTNKAVTNALAQKAPNTVMSAATASAAGAVGLVPAPVAGEQNKYLRGDGTWGTPEYVNTDTKVTNTLATTTKAYITGTTSATTNTGTQVFDTGVYLDTTAGRLRATEFSENGKLLADKYRARLSCTVGQSSPVSDPWFKVGDIIFGNAAYKNYDHMTTFRVFKPYADNGKAVGVLTTHIRTTAEGAFSSGELIWEYAGEKIPVDNFKMACQTGSTSFTVELWVKIPYEWQYYHFDYIAAGNRTGIFNGVGWNLKTHGADGVASITEGYKIIDATMLQLRNPIANNMYLPTAGGTMTGDISYQGTKATFSMIRFLDNTTTAYGNGISIGGGGLTVIGGGESATTMQNTVADFENEKMFVCNDASIDFYSNCNNGASTASHYWMDGGRMWSERFIAQNDFCINNKVSMQYDSDAECVNFVFS